VVQSLKEHFLLKIVSDPAEKPERYLGAMIGKYQFADGSQAWYMSADDYLSKAIPTVEEACAEKLRKRCTSPLPPDYHPELDTTPLLNDDGVSLFASYIGILQWAAELGRVDLAHSVALCHVSGALLVRAIWRQCYAFSDMSWATFDPSSSSTLRIVTGRISIGI